MTRLLRRLAALLVPALLLATPAAADQTNVAVAANFTEPAKAIAAAFKQRTGHEAVLSFGATGQLYAQAARGAPFQVLLAADTERPAKAEQEGVGVRGSRFTYAVGRLVLYSRTPGLVDGRGAVLRQPARFAKVAIADPVAAPYGLAATQVLDRLGVRAAVEPKIVKGSSITQAYQFVETGAAELGFVAQSQLVGVSGGSRWLVPERLHQPIDQGAVLLTAGKDSVAASAFLAFVKGAEARAIIRRYGYRLP